MEIKSKFRFFRQNNFTYLDSAATTQVPDTVIQSVSQTLGYRGNPGRSAHVVSNKNQKIIDKARSTVASFIGAKTKEIVFTNNTTDSINLAIDSILGQFIEDDIILISISEHHSNLLPYLKATSKGSRIKLLGIKDGLVDVNAVKRALTKNTKMVAIAHCSNVFGNINNVEEIGKVIKDFNSNIFFIVDGAQAVAHIPVDVKKIQADFYAFSSHKMYGPDGVGVLYVNEKIHHLLSPVRAGGGSVKNVAITFEKDFDIISPDYDNSLTVLEGGTLNTSNIAGLSSAIGFLRSIGWQEIRDHEIFLTNKLIKGLSQIKGLKIYGPKDSANKIGVVSFAIKDISLKELSEYLATNKICIRHGSHCAFPLADFIGDETLRVSLGVYNTEEDIDIVLQEIKSFLNRKSGKIVNQNLERLKNVAYTKQVQSVSSKTDILKLINSSIKSVDTEVVIMGGHFLSIPDIKENKFYPSIKDLLPARLHGLLEEFGMTTFPVFSFDLATDIVSSLKKKKINAKLLIVANDTTGINELRLSAANKDKKTAEQYRNELLKIFSEKTGLPQVYEKILLQKNLDKNDIITHGKDYFFRETLLRDAFKSFVSKNKKFFPGIVDYVIESDGDIDMHINILDNQEIKTCTFDTFHSKTGGKFCIVEVAQLAAELFGVSSKVDFQYLNEKIKTKSSLADKVFVLFSPAMCNNAVNGGAELFIKLFLQGQEYGLFKFINIPLGPRADKTLSTGVEATEIVNK